MEFPTKIKIAPPFLDIPGNHPFAQAIATATEYGLISEDTHALGIFQPDDSITHAEIAKKSLRWYKEAIE
ncbi:MAG: S-layer homology domain-containing protein [Candidatus Peribacteraceae bacterium]|jgi:hypothetical protein